MESIAFPVRINRYLALKNYASRREADLLIQNGRVTINGKPAKLGDRVKKNDVVAVDTAKNEKELVYLAYHKPAGIITHSPKSFETGIQEILKFRMHIYPIGRLDKDSRGLIILTNDGRITGKLLNPEERREKEYRVLVDKKLDADFPLRMMRGVKLDDGYMTKQCHVVIVGERSFSIILTEGKKRQIRRMCEALGYRVTDLLRTRIMNIRLGDLKPGHYTELKGAELKDFLKSIQLEK